MTLAVPSRMVSGEARRLDVEFGQLFAKELGDAGIRQNRDHAMIYSATNGDVNARLALSIMATAFARDTLG
jgi:hypothetical protein